MADWNAFDRYVRDAMPGWHCPGVALAVLRGDDVLYRAAHGLRDVERGLPLTPDTRFAMASVTKSFTAMSVALLVDEGKLAWDQPIREVVPELILHDTYASAHLSLRDMLSHRSGLPRHDLAAWRLDLPRAEFVKRMRHLRFSAGFREKFQYNNLMYYVTAHVVERVAGQRWEDFVRERIFEPLGMTASNFEPEPPRAGQENALGYRVDRDEDGVAKGLIPLPFGAHTELSPGAAGALFSNLDDQTRWLGLHANGGRLGETRLVTPETCAQMHLPVTVQPGGGPWGELMGNTVFTYAMGWSVEPYRGHTVVQHGGNVEGHSLMVGFVPRERTGVVVLTNGAGMPLRDALFYEALDRALGLEPRDWSARMHGLFDTAFRGMERGKATAARERVPDAPPTHPLEAFAGTYGADGYPDFAVRHEGGALQARLVGSLDWTPLRHLHFDVFEWDLQAFDERMLVRFLTNDQGELDAVALPIESEVGDVTFRHRPAVFPEPVIEALLGTYDTPVAGLAFTFDRRHGKLVVTQSGGSAKELTAYRLDDDAVGLRAERVRYEFAREGGRIERLVVKAPGMVWEAVRRTAT
jgi:CubicO group peptidase (beta-lactamase class C family)